MNETDVATLQAELASHPDWDDKGALEVADLMNAPTGDPGQGAVGLDAVGDYLLLHGKLDAIRKSTNTGAEALTWLLRTSHITALDPAQSDVQAIFVAIRDAGLLAGDDLQALRQLAETAPSGPSLAEQLFGWPVYPENIEQAREAA
ncbi:MAG: hypothetical protein PVH68_06865 [Armatimonadota bacterium]